MVLTTSTGLIPPFFCQKVDQILQNNILFSLFQNGFLLREISKFMAKQHVVVQGAPKFLVGLGAISEHWLPVV